MSPNTPTSPSPGSPADSTAGYNHVGSPTPSTSDSNIGMFLGSQDMQFEADVAKLSNIYSSYSNLAQRPDRLLEDLPISRASPAPPPPQSAQYEDGCIDPQLLKANGPGFSSSDLPLSSSPSARTIQSFIACGGQLGQQQQHDIAYGADVDISAMVQADYHYQPTDSGENGLAYIQPLSLHSHLAPAYVAAAAADFYSHSHHTDRSFIVAPAEARFQLAAVAAAAAGPKTFLVNDPSPAPPPAPAPSQLAELQQQQAEWQAEVIPDVVMADFNIPTGLSDIGPSMTDDTGRHVTPGAGPEAGPEPEADLMVTTPTPSLPLPSPSPPPPTDTDGNHRLNKKELFDCPHSCDEQFGRRCDLNRHVLKHTRPSHCTKCTQTFNNDSDLRRHVKDIHQKERVKCEYCESKSRDMGNLKKHMEAKHGIPYVKSKNYKNAKGVERGVKKKKGGKKGRPRKVSGEGDAVEGGEKAEKVVEKKRGRPKKKIENEGVGGGEEENGGE